MSKIILMQENDRVIIVNPIDISFEQFVQQNPEAKIVDTSALPDPAFRDAWTIDCKINLTKAKKIWQDKIRMIRDKKLKDLDIKWMRAMERGETKIAASYAAEKQVLRDLPEREELLNATSVEEIKNFWPDVLN